MPRKYQRKNETPEQRALTQLQRLWKTHARADGRPRGFQLAPRTDQEFLECESRFSTWIHRARESPLAYAILLQVWLEGALGGFPAGVFVDDIQRPRHGQGRPPEVELGQRALYLYRPGKRGFAAVAKQLDASSYQRDPEAAKRRIKAAIKAYLAFRARRSSLEDLAFRMLGLDDDGRVPEAEMPDEIAELMAELNDDSPADE